MGNPSDDEVIALVKAAFPGAEVVEIRDIPKPLTGPERWQRCWEREAREAVDWRNFHHPFAADLDAVQQEGYKASFYAQLRGIAIKMGRKPGWAAHFYKSVHGAWPKREWGGISPMNETPQTKLVVEARDSLYRFERKKERERLAAAAAAEVEKTLDEIEGKDE